MFRISKDSPAYYLTSVAKDRSPIFRTTAAKNVPCSALDEARRSAGFLLLAYVLVTDHLHAIIGSELKPSKVLQYVNGIVVHRVIGFLKTNGYHLSLKKIRHAKKDREYQYSLWDHHPQAKILTSEDVVLQKVNYVHQNPVRAGLVKRAEDCRWSSVRCWAGTMGRRAFDDGHRAGCLARKQARHSLALINWGAVRKAVGFPQGMWQSRSVAAGMPKNPVPGSDSEIQALGISHSALNIQYSVLSAR